MKDGYSFHSSEESLKETYGIMDKTYSRIFQRCGLKFRAVEADSGAIGGSGSQEFMILADAGEDEILFTENGKYAANVEKAISIPSDFVPSKYTEYEKIVTPNTETIAKLAEFLKCSPTQIVKNVLYEVIYDSGITVLVLASIRGDRDVNEVKLQNELVKLAQNYQAKSILSLKVPDLDSQKTWSSQPLPLGYISPDLADSYINKIPKVATQFLRLVDRTAADLKNFVTGADEANCHGVGANWGVEFPMPKLIVDVNKAKVGDRSVHDPNQTLQTARGIEVGHIFQLGIKYSQAMNATFTNENGEEIPLIMGCYGLGVSRLAQAAVEQSHDKDGIIWNVAIAHYHVIICVPNVKDIEQMHVAERLLTELNQAGIETILDDRDERAGLKFKDADLVGIPYRIVTGRSITEGKVELVNRATKEVSNIAIDGVVESLLDIIFPK